MLSSRTISVGGVEWHVREGGASPPGVPPVVLVHGLVVSSAYMVPTAELLAEHVRVLAPDLPGFGRSGKPAAPLDVEGMAAALAAWMDAEGIPRASFAGNSLGCQVIAALACRAPERVARCVLIGPSADPDAGPLDLAKRLVVDATRERPRLLLVHARDDLRAGLRRIVATARHALRDDLLRRAPRVRAPTLVLRGTRDPVFTRRAARRLLRRLPDARLVELPGAPHAANYSAPEAVVEACLAFLRAPDEAPPAAAARGARGAWRRAAGARHP